MQLRHIANRTTSETTPPSPDIAPTLAVKSPTESIAVAAPTPARSARGLDARDILSSIGELVYDWDITTDKLTWGTNLAEVLGPIASVDLSSGLAFGERIAIESAASRYDAILKSELADQGQGVPYQVVYALAPPRDGAATPLVWIEDTGRWFAGLDQRPVSAHGVVRIVTERHEKERLLAINSQFDPLTSVLNRAHMSEHVQRNLSASERNRKCFAVLLVALENLFVLNRTYGYDAGDEVIAGLAKRLHRNVRVTDVVARHAGNKFAIVLDNCDTEQMKAAAIRLLDVVQAAPFETSVGAIPATIRIGGVIAPREGRTPHVLFQHAEEALDVARQRNGARLVAYTTSLAREDARLRALKIADSIVSALNDRRVELAFQPIVHAVLGEPAFYEALLRVRLADGSLVEPGSILPIAEKAGLVRLLDQRVMELALAHLIKDESLRLSVNCSIATIQDPEWPDRLTKAVSLNPGVAQRLTVEITETSMIEDFDTARNLIASCKRLGVKVAMDDFGAGHTSFRNLRELAFDLVKVDGAFIRNIATSSDDRFFVRTLIDLAHHLQLKIVAEWVEDEETANILRDWGVDYLQGAFFGSAETQPGRACAPNSTRLVKA